MNAIERKKKDAERKRKARLLESDEQKRLRRQANADRNRANRGTRTPEQREVELARLSSNRATRTPEQREVDLARYSSYRAMPTPEQRQVELARLSSNRATRTPEQREVELARLSSNRAIRTPEQREVELARLSSFRSMRTPEQREVDLARYSSYRASRTSEQREIELARLSSYRNSRSLNYEDDENDVPDIAKYVETDEAMKLALEYLLQTKVGPAEKFADIDDSSSQYYQANVCVICDEFIIGTSHFVWLSKTKILKHKTRLSNPDISESLRRCYQVDDEDLKDILLSPRAKCTFNDEYMCCSSCNDALRESRIGNVPPKYAIANGWAIGTLPDEILMLITEVTGPLLAIVRPFAYVMSYCGGAHKSIKGSITFFSQDVEQNVGSLQFHSDATNNSNVYVVLAGRFTPEQRNIVKQRCLLQVENMKTVFNWLKENNCLYAGMANMDNCPKPQIVEDPPTQNNTEQSGNSNVEKFIQFQYWFPSLGEPNTNTCTFNTEEEFLRAVLTAKEPTLIYTNNKSENDWSLSLPKIFPLYFPYGVGGIKEGRATKVSDIECMRHYLRLSLPQFQKADFILVLCQMYLRRAAFQSAYVRVLSRSRSDGVSVAQSISTISDTDIMNAAGITNSNDVGQSNSAVGSLLRTISTSCREIPHMDEAAKVARTKMFGLWTTLGPPSLFFTISPCDECSFRVQLFANPKPQKLPNSNISNEECVLNLFMRSKMREENPGACAREFQALLDIIIECLIGWCKKQGKQIRKGIFGKVKGWSIAIEEQGRKTLHGHLLLYIELFNKLILLLWSTNESEREQAKSNMISYLKKVMSSSYDISEEELSHSKPLHNTTTELETNAHSNMPIHELPNLHGSNENNICRVIPDTVNSQTLHQMRKKHLCMELCGTVGNCAVCQKSFSTTDLVWSAIQNWYPAAVRENEHYFPRDLQFPLTKEQLDLYALRFMYDASDNIPPEHTTLIKILIALSKLRFNEHDYRHRMSCFKKSCECRFSYPRVPQKTFDIVFSKTNVDSLWYQVFGGEPNLHSRAFSVETPRGISDLFLNTHNPVVSRLLGYNSNITMGSHSLIYYSTLYTSKGTQKEEKYPFLIACTAIAKRIRWKKQQQESNEENRPQQNASEVTLNADFKVGLGHVLSGIMANISSTIMSAPMAWYIVMNESRFQFSHEMVPILLSQAEDWLNEIPIQFRYRQTKKKQGWLDSSLWNCRYRPTHGVFQDMSYWQFTEEYESKTKSTSARKRDNDIIDEPTEDDNHDENAKQWEYDTEHPGRDYICIKKRKSACIPMLYYRDQLPDLADCKLELPNDEVEPRVLQIRNEYATKALLLFYPFRNVEDIPPIQMRWSFYTDAVQQNTLLYGNAQKLLQNIQNIHNSKKLESPLDSLGENVDENCESSDIMQDSEMSNYNEASNGNLANDHNNSEYNFDVLFEEMVATTELKVSVNDKHYLPSRQQLPLPAFSKGLLTENPIICTSNTTESAESTELSDTYAHITSRRRSLIQVIMDVTNPSSNITLPTADSSSSTSDIIQSMDMCIAQFKLDKKQSATFNIICSSFMMTYLDEFAESNCDVFNKDSIEAAKQKLLGRGGSNNLKMMLTGKGGGGKSHVISAIEHFCKYFCNATNHHFSSSVLIITASTNSAAADINGRTIHSAAQLNCSQPSIISENCDIQWKEARLIIIDEISMLSVEDWFKLDKNLRDLMKQCKGISGKVYGGLPIVFSGDFFQLTPVGGTPVYITDKNIYWDDINRCVILDGNHRFEHDPLWGEMLDRLRLGESTEEDIKLINSRVIGVNGLKLPTRDELNGENISYCCKTNRMRNVVSDNNFLNILRKFHPLKNSDEDAPSHTIIIKGVLADSDGTIKSNSFHNGVFSGCGDADIKSSGTEKVDPCLKLYVGCPIMVSVSEFKSTCGVVKGSIGTFAGIVFRDGCRPKTEIWNGYKVLAIDATDVEYIICEKPKKKADTSGKPQLPEYFILPNKTFRVKLSLPLGTTRKLYPENTTMKLTQFPINVDLGTTCHKLQGKSKAFLVITEFDYATENWIYVALSRVKTLSGLFLLKPLNFKKDFSPSDILMREMRGLETKEYNTLQHLQENGYY